MEFSESDNFLLEKMRLLKISKVITELSIKYVLFMSSFWMIKFYILVKICKLFVKVFVKVVVLSF